MKMELLNSEEAQRIRGGDDCGAFNITGCDTHIMFKTSGDCLTFFFIECYDIETNCSVDRPFDACVPNAFHTVHSPEAPALTAE